MLQIISTGEHLALDLVRSMDNLKKAIMTYRKGRPGRGRGRGGKREGGFLAFWRSVDAAETIKKVTFYHYVTLSFPLIELPGIFTYAAIIS